MPRSVLDVSQISWRTSVAHHPTEDNGPEPCIAELIRI
jgi:hypothetical protein